MGDIDKNIEIRRLVVTWMSVKDTSYNWLLSSLLFFFTLISSPPSNLFFRPLGAVPIVQTTFGITIIFMFQFLNSLIRTKYLSIFSFPFLFTQWAAKMARGGSYGIIFKALDYVIIVKEFQFQIHYYIHFWTNTIGEHMNTLIPPPLLLLVFCKDGFGLK